MIAGRDGGTRRASTARSRSGVRFRSAHRTAQGAPNGAGGETRPVRFAIRLMTCRSPFGFLLASDPPPRRVGAVVGGGRGGAVHADRLSAGARRAGGVAERRLPAGGAGRVGHVGGVAGRRAPRSSARPRSTSFTCPPVGRFTLQDSSNWVALGAFLVVAMLASSVAEVTRARTRDAEERRREADLAAEMARLLLRGDSLAEALPTAAARLAQTLELSSAAIEMDAVEGDERSDRVSPARGHQPAGNAAGRRGHLRGEPAPACRSASCRRWRHC